MSQNEARFTVRSLIVTAAVTAIATVMVLETSGKIDHSDNKDHVPVGDFQAVHVTPDEPFRMSPKASELHAACVDGFLAIAADVDPSFRGIPRIRANLACAVGLRSSASPWRTHVKRQQRTSVRTGHSEHDRQSPREAGRRGSDLRGRRRPAQRVEADRLLRLGASHRRAQRARTPCPRSCPPSRHLRPAA